MLAGRTIRHAAKDYEGIPGLDTFVLAFGWPCVLIAPHPWRILFPDTTRK